ncbi:MAG: phosphatase PAP2 family protein [Gammaproteobacteria bacterium]|nr:phosphatase PAP2 family protein [Gammaproteobacteria bacterium]MYC98782.1 phosphatase PAP2 family protein [Gammaproteobacteria bacterium]
MMAALRAYDERMLDVITARRKRWLDIFMRGVTHAGDWPSMVGITLILSFGFPSGLRRVGLECMAVLAVSHLAVQLMKRTINRARPKLRPTGLFVLKPPDRFSFPSGHATAGLAVAIPLYVALPALAAFTVLGLGLAIGVSRAYLGVHYPGDVLMGWVTAIVTALIV